MRRWFIVGLVVAAVGGGGVALAQVPSGAPGAGPELLGEALAGVSIGESRAAVTRALGPGVARESAATSDGLGACSFGFCRAYRVDGAIIGIDFNRDSDRVDALETRSRALRIEGVPVSAGLTAVRAALHDWQALACTGGGSLLVKAAGPAGPTAQLVFTGAPFAEAIVARGPPPGGCAVPGTTRTRLVSDPWVVLETGPGARSLVVQSLAAPCGGAPHPVVLRRTRRAVVIAVREWVPVEPVACPRDLWIPRSVLALRAPLAGRRIEGPGLSLTRSFDGRVRVSLRHPHDWFMYLTLDRPDRAILPEVPRVLGLDPRQAAYVLALQGFRTRLLGHGRQVVAQDPPRGEVPADSRACCSTFAGDVTITAGA